MRKGLAPAAANETLAAPGSLAGAEKLYRKVINQVLGQLDAGEFRVGSRLPAEREIADANAVSRTTVREAMVALEMLGIVEMRKGSGIYVISTTGVRAGVPDLEIGAFELIEARRLLEGEIAAMAAVFATDDHVRRLEDLLDRMSDPDIIRAEQADRDFHVVVAEATGNGALSAVVTELWTMRERAPLARSILHRAREPGLAARIEEHRAILAGIKARDGVAAREAMRAHLERVIEYLLNATENDDLAAVKSRTASLRERAARIPTTK